MRVPREWVHRRIDEMSDEELAALASALGEEEPALSDEEVQEALEASRQWHRGERSEFANQREVERRYGL